VVVVGGGPAGMAAVRAALAAGARVTLLESSDALGGQFWRHLPEERAGAKEAKLHHNWDTYASLRDAVLAHPRCDVRLESQVWSLETTADGRPALNVLTGPPDSVDREPSRLEPDALVLATGAHDRTLPFPGWTLPGVFTAGAAQAFAKSERIAVGKRVVVAGAGPFLLPVMSSLVAARARVVGVYEANRLRNLRHWVAKAPWRMLGAAHKGGELLEYVSAHVRHRVPYRTGHVVVAAHGTTHVERVTLAKVDANWAPIAGTEFDVEADAVCVSHGFTPRIELAIAAGCEISPERFVRVDARQRTSVPGVYAAGEITSIGGCDSALAEGEIAGYCAAGGAPGDRALRRAVRSRDTFVHFADRLEAAHGIRRGWTAWLQRDTLLCRCEETKVGTFTDAVRTTGAPGLRSTKLSTRAGLGICQGRICGRNVEALLAVLTGSPEGDGASTDRRPVVTPVRLGDLASVGACQPRASATPTPRDHQPTSGVAAESEA
jgi:NADPH-dependent 2,4-dienoyl-CoA reductase/sulfur reductase-like enzyme